MGLFWDVIFIFFGWKSRLLSRGGRWEPPTEASSGGEDPGPPLLEEAQMMCLSVTVHIIERQDVPRFDSLWYFRRLRFYIRLGIHISRRISNPFSRAYAYINKSLHVGENKTKFETYIIIYLNWSCFCDVHEKKLYLLPKRVQESWLWKIKY